MRALKLAVAPTAEFVGAFDRSDPKSWLVEWCDDLFNGTVYRNSAEINSLLTPLTTDEILARIDGWHIRDIIDACDRRWIPVFESQFTSEVFETGASQAIDRLRCQLVEVELLNELLASSQDPPITRRAIFWRRIRAWKYQELCFLRHELMVRYHKTRQIQYRMWLTGRLASQRFWWSLETVPELIEDYIKIEWSWHD